MSYARTSLKGVVFHDSRRAYNGVTLLTPLDGKGAWLIDMLGRTLHCWQTPYPAAGDARLLASGNLLYAGKLAGSPLAELDGAGGVLMEMNWDGDVIWQYEDLYLHDGFSRMDNGNTLVTRWVEVPGEIAGKVVGGDPGSERDGVMWGDALEEITPQGRLVWEWVAHEHLKPEEDIGCLVCPRSEWTHLNAVEVLGDGNILVSFMKTNTIAIIERETGRLKWKWGPGELAHQHSPSRLDNGHILVFDNGFHPYGFPWGFSRVLEVDPESGAMVWSYGGGAETTEFYSATMSSCQRLPNNNTLICEGNTGRIFEVDYKGRLVWEFANNLPSDGSGALQPGSRMVYTAYRYGMDYPGLKEAVR